MQNSCLSTPSKQISVLLKQFTHLKDKISVKKSIALSARKNNKPIQCTFSRQNSFFIQENREPKQSSLEALISTDFPIMANTVHVDTFLKINQNKQIVRGAFEQIEMLMQFIIDTFIEKINFINKKLKLFNEAIQCYNKIKEHKKQKQRGNYLQTFINQLKNVQKRYQTLIQEINTTHQQKILSLKEEIETKEILIQQYKLEIMKKNLQKTQECLQSERKTNKFFYPKVGQKSHRTEMTNTNKYINHSNRELKSSRNQQQISQNFKHKQANNISAYSDQKFT